MRNDDGTQAITTDSIIVELQPFIVVKLVTNQAPYFETEIPNYNFTLPYPLTKFDIPTIRDDDSEVAYIEEVLISGGTDCQRSIKVKIYTMTGNSFLVNPPNNIKTQECVVEIKLIDVMITPRQGG